MDRSGDNEPRRWHMDGEKYLALRRLRHAALAAAQARFEHVLQRIASDGGCLDEALRPARFLGDENDGAPRGAFGIKGFQNVQLHNDFPQNCSDFPSLAARIGRERYSTFST